MATVYKRGRTWWVRFQPLNLYQDLPFDPDIFPWYYENL